MMETWRRLALYLLLLGMAGVALELLLLNHFEDAWQWAPLALLAVGLVVAGAFALRPSATRLRALQLLMMLYLLASGVGIFLHLKSNVEFERELRPSIGGWELVKETLTGAMPALAPGAMAQLGLLGLLVGYKNPVRTTPGPVRVNHE